MFEPSSRYASIEQATLELPHGREVHHVRRRFLPQGSTMPVLAEVTVTDSDRLDLVAARTLGDPELFWRVADANDAMNPFDLVTEPGALLRVPVPQAGA